MIDTHVHILPAIDDGARDLAMSLAMIRSAMADGVTAMVATPHQANGPWQNPRREVIPAVDALQSAIDEAGLKFLVAPGAEVSLSADFPQMLDDNELLTMGDHGKHLLLELPKSPSMMIVGNVVERLKSAGITPIIAHPERVSALSGNDDNMALLRRAGCLMQVTAQSCTGEFGAALQRCCRRWIDCDWIDMIASDGHRDQGRPPLLGSARDWVTGHYGGALAGRLLVENPRRCLLGEEITLPAFRSPEPRRWRMF